MAKPKPPPETVYYAQRAVARPRYYGPSASHLFRGVQGIREWLQGHDQTGEPPRLWRGVVTWEEVDVDQYRG